MPAMGPRTVPGAGADEVVAGLVGRDGGHQSERRPELEPVGRHHTAPAPPGHIEHCSVRPAVATNGAFVPVEHERGGDVAGEQGDADGADRHGGGERRAPAMMAATTGSGRFGCGSASSGRPRRRPGRRCPQTTGDGATPSQIAYHDDEPGDAEPDVGRLDVVDDGERRTPRPLDPGRGRRRRRRAIRSGAARPHAAGARRPRRRPTGSSRSAVSPLRQTRQVASTAAKASP